MDNDEFIDSEKFQENNYIEDDNIVLHNGKVLTYNNEFSEISETQEQKELEIDYSKLYRSLQKNIKNNCLDLLTVKSDFEIYCNFVKFIDDFYK